MSQLKYILKGFGYDNVNDFLTTNFKIFYIPNAQLALTFTGVLGTIRMFSETYLGLDLVVLSVFVLLIVAETTTGMKVALKIKKHRIQSRKIGRMLLKIGIYIFIVFMLYSLSSRMKNPSVLGIELNPFEWLYYVFFTGIIFQLVISYLENLAALGYDEANGIMGIILRKYNKWFEFDGSKNADNE